MESIDSKETYEYGTRKDLASEKEETKYNNLTKWYKKWLTLMMLQKKTWKNIIQTSQKFLIVFDDMIADMLSKISLVILSSKFSLFLLHN